jgi:competence protein ComEC
MTPLTIFWFQQASMMSIPANLVAIPLISLLVMPMIFISILLLPLAPGAAGLLLQAAAEVLSGFESTLELTAILPWVLQKTAAPCLALTLVGLAGVLLLLAPRATPGRYCGIVLLLPLLFGKAAAPATGSMELTLLDVGQGSAALLHTSRHLLLYDTGPGDGVDRNLVDSTIVPAIKNIGLNTPDKIIVSHADLDHAGGLARLSELYPSTEWITSLPATRLSNTHLLAAGRIYFFSTPSGSRITLPGQ